MGTLTGRKKRILLTGDDGYNSIGTRLLIRLLKSDFDLTVAGTVTQQSGVGGMLNVRNGGRVGETTLEGVPALWVDGSPSDAVLCARTHYGSTFDLTISGMNLGINVSADIFSSGTFVAAHRAVIQGLSKKAMAVSFDTHASQYHKDHNGTDALDQYVEYPGKAVRAVIDLAFAEKFWGAELLNVNLPYDPTRTIRFTTVVTKTFNFWPSPVVDIPAGRFSYPLENPTDREKRLTADTTVVKRGDISVSPITLELTDRDRFAAIRNKTIRLEL